LDFFNSIFGDLLAQFGFHLEIEMTVLPPGSRRRREVGDSPLVDVKVKLSGDANDAIDGEVDDDALEAKAAEVATEVETTVTDGVSNYSGDVIDNTSTPEVSAPNVIGACDIEARSVINCEPGNIGIAVPACGFPERANPFMNNANCAGTLVGDQLVFTAGAGDCELVPTADGTHLIYDTSIEWEEGVANAIISRVNTIKVDFQCILKTTYSVSLDTGITPMLSMVDVDLGSTEGTFELALGLWEDNTFSTPLPADAVINVPDNLYVAAVLNDAGSFVTSLETCWATPSADPTDATKYEFIVNGCPEANEDAETLSIIANGQAAAASFSIASFQFNGDANAEIYIHCQIHICDPGMEPCEPQCNARRRRDADDTKLVQNTVGPIRVNKAD